MEIKTFGVIGAGQMGNGIAHVFALAGYEVRLNDVDEARIDKALELIERVGMPSLGLLLDTFHMNIEEADIAATIRQHAP